MIPPRIKNITPLDNFCLEITYITGEKKLYDMKKNLHENFFKALNDIDYFKMAKSAETTIELPNGEDIDPNELYTNSTII